MNQNPRIENRSEELDVMKFTLSDLNVSIANGLRRTIIADIPIVVFRTHPYEESKTNMITNTTRLNNEILKQRLSCIPIHITDLDMPLGNYLVEVNVENLTNTIIYVTTEDFRIKNVTTGDYLTKADQQAIFPPNEMTGYYIDFARLRPKISEDIPGEKLHFTSEFSIATAKDDGMFNVVSTCSYGFTKDDAAVEEALAKKQQEWKDAGLTKEDIAFNSKDFMLLDAQRIVKRDSFDFIIQTVGVFSNQDICHKACDILINKLKNLDTLLETDSITISPADNTMSNCYDIILENEDYTIGKVIEYYLYSKFFEGIQILSYCGFKKMHPHDKDGIIRVAYKEEVEMVNIMQNLKECIADAVYIYEKIKGLL